MFSPLKYSLLFSCLFLVACGSDNDTTLQPTQPSQPSEPESSDYNIKDKNNYISAYKFDQRYNQVVENCGSLDKPAYMCSGVVFRGIRVAAQPKPWFHRDKDRNKGVISLAYIRQDLNFKLPESTYHAGIIIKPDYENTVNTRCASPMDMNTDYRANSPTRCLQSQEDKYSAIDYTVKDCQDWGIDTADKWLETFIPIMRETKRKGSLDQFPGQTCSFTTSKDQPEKFAERAKYFNLFADIRKGIPKDLRPDWWNNELLIDTWNDQDAQTAPIEAFYYNFGNQAGLTDAQSFQQKYYEDTKVILPIIAVEFNTDESSHFFYSTHDQIVFKQAQLSDLDQMKLTIELFISESPQQDSATFQKDKEQYQQLLDTGAARWNLATQDSNVSTTYLIERFTQTVDPRLNNANVSALVDYVVSFEQSAVSDIKAKYKRQRPFQYYQASTCTPNDEVMLAQNGSYPSGHTVRGFLVDGALSQVQPESKAAFQLTAQDYAKSRIVCKAHWLSDTVAGEQVSQIILNTLQHTPTFKEKVALAQNSLN